jgi:hypothetical protein
LAQLGYQTATDDAVRVIDAAHSETRSHLTASAW